MGDILLFEQLHFNVVVFICYNYFQNLVLDVDIKHQSLMVEDDE